MLDSGKKIRALWDKKKRKNIPTLVLSEKKIYFLFDKI